MKITAILFALLLGASFTFAAEGDAKKPAEPAKPAEGAKKPEGDKPKATPEEMFTKKDKNSDGKLSKEEFVGKKSKDPAKSEAEFTAKDKDKDGSVSKEEYLAGGKKKKDK